MILQRLREWRERRKYPLQGNRGCMCTGVSSKRCTLHDGPCPFEENGERYGRVPGVPGSPCLPFCTACALERDDIQIGRGYGAGFGSRTQWAIQRERDGGPEAKPQYEDVTCEHCHVERHVKIERTEGPS